jgi:hypothetical protein
MPVPAYIMRDQSRLCPPSHLLLPESHSQLRRLARRFIEVTAFLAALASFLVALALVA